MVPAADVDAQCAQWLNAFLAQNAAYHSELSAYRSASWWQPKLLVLMTPRADLEHVATAVTSHLSSKPNRARSFHPHAAMIERIRFHRPLTGDS
jgi:hypothetical protein